MTLQAIEAEKQLVVFDLAEEGYGVDISSVREIIRMQEITRVPRAPDFVEGVINLRGRVIPVVDLRKRFGFKETEWTKDTRTRHWGRGGCGHRGVAPGCYIGRAAIISHHYLRFGLPSGHRQVG